MEMEKEHTKEEELSKEEDLSKEKGQSKEEEQSKEEGRSKEERQSKKEGHSKEEGHSRGKRHSKEAVIIKSFPNGIALRLDAELPFDRLLELIGYKFSEARSFFGNAAMALSIEGRPVTDAEELMILEEIRENSDLRILCLVEQDEEIDGKFVKALDYMEEKFADEERDGQFYRGNLKNRDVLETENSIVMLGDVHPGSAVISAKNIIILGGLYGEAYAGGNGREGAFVAALEMKPERIKIGDFKYKPSSRQLKRVLQPKVRPKIAYVKNDRIILDILTKDLLNAF